MTTTGDKVFVDTNILIRFLVTAAQNHSRAEEIVQAQLLKGAELWISRQVIREYLVQVTRPQAFMEILDSAVIDEQIKVIQSMFRVADETAEVTAQLLQLLKEYPTRGKQIHDANIVATMLVNGVDTLLTMNVADFQRFQGRITLVPLHLDII